MSAILIHCDEDIDSIIWRGLRRVGISVTSVAEKSQLGMADVEVLRWASANGRALLTHNVRDFPRLHAETLSIEERHSGIMVAARKLSNGQIIRRVQRLCSVLSAQEMFDRLEFLAMWS